MTIFIVANSSWGIYNFRRNLASSLKEAGYEVYLIFPYSNEDKYFKELSNEFSCLKLQIWPNSSNPFKDLTTFVHLSFFIARYEPKYILNFTIKPNLYGSLSSRLFKKKYINNITGLGTVFIKKTLLSKLVIRLYKFALYSSECVFFQNEDDLKLFKNNKIIKNSTLTKILPGSGVDINKFSFEEMKEKNVVEFLYIGRMIFEKGLYELIEAIEMVKQKTDKKITFKFLGDIDPKNPRAISKSEIDYWVKSGLISYSGFTDNIYKHLIKCDCLILPSYREGMPRTVLEAFAVGRPAIVFDVPGCREIVDGKTGIKCKDISPSSLAEAILKMANTNFNTRKKLGANARKLVVKSYDEQKVINQYLGLIQDSEKK